MTGKARSRQKSLVQRLDVGEPHAADDENAEQRRHDKGNGASSSQFRDAAGERSGRLVDKVVMMSPSALHPRAVKVARHRPVYWLAGLSVPSAFPERMAPVASYEGQLSAYSCGGSRGLKAFALHRVPVLRPACRMREPTTLGTIDWSSAAASPIRRGRASPLTSPAPKPFSEAELTVSSKMRSEKGMR